MKRKFSSPFVQFFLRLPSGKLKTCYCAPTTTIFSLKQRVCSEDGYPTLNQTWFWNFRELKDDKTIWEEQLRNDITIQIRISSAKGWKPVHFACEIGKADALKKILKQNYTQADASNSGVTPLHLCCKVGFSDGVRILMRCASTIDPIDKKGATPLTEAIIYDKPMCAKLLLQHGANPDHMYKDECLLYIAAKMESFSCVDELIVHGASLKCSEENRCLCSLHDQLGFVLKLHLMLGKMMKNTKNERENTATDNMDICSMNCEERFYAEHKKVFLQYLQKNPGLIEGNLAYFFKHHDFFPFETKRDIIQGKITQLVQASTSPLKIKVTRSNILEESFVQVTEKIPTLEKFVSPTLKVKFRGEPGVDVGGVRKEWFLLLSRELLNPDYALFSVLPDCTYKPNILSHVNRHHLQYFRFIGYLIGLALINNVLLDFRLYSGFYKAVLNLPISRTDLKFEHEDLYKNLCSILENRECIEDLCLDFTADIMQFDEIKNFELKDGGASIPVTSDNVEEYVDLLTEFRLLKGIEKQMDSLVKGIDTIFPLSYLKLLTEKELEILLCGDKSLDIDDWKRNTLYSGYSRKSPQIQWFWKIVEDLTDRERELLLEFVTSSNRVPIGGFAFLMSGDGIKKFKIHKAPYYSERLPSSHTCFNELVLPEYPTQEILQERLLYAVVHSNKGFALS